MFGSGWKAAIDETLRMAPARRSSIAGRKASVSSCTATALSATISDSRLALSS
jgi:hypothetical protein